MEYRCHGDGDYYYFLSTSPPLDHRPNFTDYAVTLSEDLMETLGLPRPPLVREEEGGGGKSQEDPRSSEEQAEDDVLTAGICSCIFFSIY